MGTSCTSLVADLFLFRNERYFIMSLSDDKQIEVIEDNYIFGLLLGLLVKY